ncbi:MAG: cob(I)yrinic acid a,c-diamide adenosyltransferase [Patescibacteria group bacterium]
MTRHLNSRKDEGLIIVNTGGGKGKTTAALGILLRACGYNLHGVMIQFIKGSWFYGEKESFKRLNPNFELLSLGKGFVGIIDDTLPISDHKNAAREAVERAKIEVTNSKNDIVVLDEINYAIHGKLIGVKDVLDIIKIKNKNLDLILTGNYVDPKIIELADTVTEMKEIKHAFSSGKLAKRGIDY